MLTLDDLHVARLARDGRLVPPELIQKTLAEVDALPSAPGIAARLVERGLLGSDAAKMLRKGAQRAIEKRLDAIYARFAVEHSGVDPAHVRALLARDAGRIGLALVREGALSQDADFDLCSRARDELAREERAGIERGRARAWAAAELDASGADADEAAILAEPTVRLVKTLDLSESSEERVLTEPTIKVTIPKGPSDSAEARVLADATVRVREPRGAVPADLVKTVEDDRVLPLPDGPSDASRDEGTERHSVVMPLTGAPLDPSAAADPEDTVKHAEVLPLPDAPPAEPSASTTKRVSDRVAPRPVVGKTLTVISGYEVERELGRGAMGVVYLARELTLKRAVALKVLPPNTGEHDAVERFTREAKAIATLDHPGIVPIYQHGESDGQYFIAMKFVDGRPLKQLAAKGLSPRRAAGIMEQVARALGYAHERGIVHRDVKPANVLVEAGDKAWVVDFGIAKLDTEATLTQAGEIMGTPAYMSPEQALQLEVGPPSDVYSIGAVLYAITVGQPPFKGQNALEVLPRVAADEPPLPRSLRPEIPADLETIILCAMAKEPERRYPSAIALADDLRRFQAGEPIAGRRPSLAYKLRRAVRRNVRLVAGFALALVLAGGAWQWREARARTRAAEDRARRSLAFKQAIDRVHEHYEAFRAARATVGAKELARLDDAARELASASSIEVDEARAQVAAWTSELAKARAETAAARRAAARELLHAADTDKAKLALADAKRLEPDHPELAALEKEAESGAHLRVRWSLEGLVLTWLKLDDERRPTGEWQLPQRTEGSSALLVATSGGAVRLRATAPGRLPLLLDVAVRPGELLFPTPPLESERTRGMVFVPAWTYVLGPPGHQCVRRAVEEKKLGRAFAIDRSEVTCAQFLRFVQDGGYRRRELWSETGRAWLEERLAAGPLEGPLDVDLAAPGRGDHPVTGVSLFEAEAYARWAGKELPGNDEWEIAARGALSNAFPWGARYVRDFFRPGATSAAPAGLLALDVSPSGCVDMAGNVREWTRDRRRDHLGNEVVERAIVKGSAFVDGEREAELLARAAAAWDRDPRTRAVDIGFRCIRWLGPEDWKAGE